MRIAVGGFQHETNTFAATKALTDVETPDAWPGLVSPRRYGRRWRAIIAVPE